MKCAAVIMVVIFVVLGYINSQVFGAPFFNLGEPLKSEATRLFSGSCEDINNQLTRGSVSPECYKFSPERNVSSELAASLIETVDDPIAIQNLVKAGGTKKSSSLDMIQQIKSMALPQFKMKATVGPLVESLGGAANLQPLDIQSLGSSLLESMPGGYIKKLPKTSFDAFLQEIFVTGGRTSEKVLTTSEGHAICEKTFKVYGKIDTVEEFVKVLPVLPCAPTEICKNIPSSLVESQLEEIKKLPWSCESNIAEDDDAEILKDQYPQTVGCAKILAKKAVSTSLNSDKFNNLGALKKCLNDNALSSLISTSTCSEALNIGRSVDISRFAKAQRKMTTRCDTDVLLSPRSVSASTLVSLGSISLNLPKVSLKQLPTDVLCDPSFIGSVKNNYNPPKRMSKAIAKRCYGNNSLTLTDITAMGSDILLNVNTKLFRNADLFKTKDSKNVLKRTLTFGRNKRKISLLRRTMQEKLDVTDMVDSPSLMRAMPISRLDSDVLDIKHDLGLDNNQTTVNLPDSKNKWGVRKWLTQTPLENITANNIREMKSLARGFSSSQIAQLNTDDLLASAIALCDQDDWPSKTVRAITREMIVPYYQAINTTESVLSSLSLTEVTLIGPECLMHLEPSEIIGASKEVCLAICEKIGSSSHLLKFRSESRRALKDTCLNCLGKSDPATSITEDDLDALGHGFVSELATELSRVDPAAFKNKVDLFRQGCLQIDSLTNIRPLIQSAFGAASDMDSSTLLQLGDLVRSLAQDGSLVDVNKAALFEASYEVVEDLEPKDERKLFLRDNCLKGLSAAEQAHQKTLKFSIMESIVSAYDTSLISRKRRKRSGSSWTCEDITSMGASIVAAPLEDILAIITSHFYDCLGQMSQYSNWEPAKRFAILERFKDEINPINQCTLTPEDLLSLGYFALSFTQADLECAPISGDDTMAALGYFHEWDEDSLITLAARYLSERSKGVQDFNITDIAIIGHVICGYSEAILATLRSSVFIEASAQIGLLKTCTSGAIKALFAVANRADTFGDISTWSVEIVSELGIILGALSSSELSALSPESFEAIQPNAIAFLPGTVLMGLSIELLKNFSLEQAQAVTDDQKNSLSSEQLAAFYNILKVDAPCQPAFPYSSSSHPVGFLVMCLVPLILSELLK